jgi:hypothetical protein
MVLIARAMRSAVLATCAAACGQSLFDAHGPTDGGGSGSGDGTVPLTCPSMCLGDASGDYDGSPAGSTGKWRYLDDHRDRTWTAMVGDASGMVGADPANKISTCAANPSSPTCASLPNALLVSTSGSSSAADPAIEFTSADTGVRQLTVRAYVPTGSPNQLVRLYRNSREDVLYSATATGGSAVEHVMAVDSLPGDRYLVAIAPAAGGAADVGVQFFVSDVGGTSKCQMAFSFATPNGSTVHNLCGPDSSSQDFNAAAIAATYGPGPYAELGQAADIVPNNYYEPGAGANIDASGDLTVQFWMRLDVVDTIYAEFQFSTIDLNVTGGVSVDTYDMGGVPRIEVFTCSQVTPTIDTISANAPYPPTLGTWHFVRVAHTGGQVSMCLDGTKIAGFPLAAGKLSSSFAPYLAKNVVWTPAGAFFDGGLDDVRVLGTALPCE